MSDTEKVISHDPEAWLPPDAPPDVHEPEDEVGDGTQQDDEPETGGEG
jgi:hypothetical protein